MNIQDGKVTPKFRAWQTKHNEMCDVTVIDFNNELFGFGYEYRAINSNKVDYWLPMDECVLMQSTGLRDKNGVEIYDGDIIEVIHHIDSSTAIKVNGAVISGQLELIDSTFEVFFGTIPVLRNQEHVLVIGNIHENPELLEKKNYNRRNYAWKFEPLHLLQHW